MLDDFMHELQPALIFEEGSCHLYHVCFALLEHALENGVHLQCLQQLLVLNADFLFEYSLFFLQLSDCLYV